MGMMMRLGGLFGGLVSMMIMVVMVIAFIVFLLVAMIALLSVVGAVVAYIKRDTWTKPAYRWARDKSGQLRYVPWNPSETADVAS
ncbi:MAG TPA: hypothetical protein VL117_12895 [Thermoleophilia bacterium]|nr:hypothetical protein [Thermoleophilia bacterium]